MITEGELPLAHLKREPVPLGLAENTSDRCESRARASFFMNSPVVATTSFIIVRCERVQGHMDGHYARSSRFSLFSYRRMAYWW